SRSSDDAVRIVLLVRARQGVSSHSAARNPFAPRMDDSRILNRPGCSDDSAYRRHILRYQPLFRSDALSIFRHRFGFVLHLVAAEVWIQRTRPLGETGQRSVKFMIGGLK